MVGSSSQAVPMISRRIACALAVALLTMLPWIHAGDQGAGADTDKTATDLYGDPLPPGATARLGTVRFRHAATSAAYSPDGALLAIGGADNEIWLFDAATGKALRHWVAHQARSYNPPDDTKNPFAVLVSSTGTGNVTTLAFFPDGKVLASGGWDDTVPLWDVKTGKELRKIDAHKAMVVALAFSPDGKVLATRGGLDGVIRLWAADSAIPLHRIEGVSKINPWRFNRTAALAFSPDSKLLAVGDLKALRLFDAASGKEARRLEGHRSCVSVAFAPGGKLLATGGIDEGKDQHSIRIWDLGSGKELRQCALPKNEPPIDLAFSADGKHLAAAVEEDDARVFEVETGKPVLRLAHYWPSRIAYRPGGKDVITVRGPAVRVWDATSGKERHLDFSGHLTGITALAVSADGKTIATGGEDVRLWDAATSKPTGRIAARGPIAALALSPDGKALAVAGRDRIVKVWDIATAKVVQELKGHKHFPMAVAFSPDGKRLASGDAQSTIHVWDVEIGKEDYKNDLKSLTDHLSLAFSPDGKTLAIGGAWNDTSFLPKGGINIQGVEVTPKEGHFVLLWDAATGKELRRLGGLEAAIGPVVFSPSGALVAASSKDGKLALWGTATGRDHLFITAHPPQPDVAGGPPPTLAFSPDGKVLASASTDKTVRLWDVQTARELGRLHSPDGGLSCLAFLPGGKALVTGGADTTALVWDIAAATKARKTGRPNVILIGD